MRFSTSALLFGMAFASAQATTLFQWSFNSQVSDGNIATGSTTASIAISPGSAFSLVGGTSGSFANGAGSTDPNLTDNSGHRSSNYPAQGTGSGTAGIQVLGSTVGYSGIRVSFDRKFSTTSSRWIQLQYTLDGSNFSSAANFETTTATTWVNNASVDLSAISGASNNASFGVRLVSIFGIPGSATGSAYTTTTGTAYSPTMANQYDMITISGTAVPEPASVAGLGLGFLAIRSRRKDH